MNIYTKLTKLQNKLKAPKGQFNKFGNYHYRNAEDILESVKPLLDEFGLTMFITDTIEVCGNRTYVKANVTLINQDKPEETIVNSAYAREEEDKKGMDGSQITGASSSYARKYALNAMFAIDDTKDSDATNTHGKTDEKKLTRDELIEKFNSLPDEEKQKHMTEQKVSNPKYFKTDFLRTIIK